MSKDLTGQRFGRLTAIGPTEKRSRRCVVWSCVCDCGNMVEIRSDHLSAKRGTRSCGCLQDETRRANANDISGQRFGRLTAIEPTTKRVDRHIIWSCVCDCGNIHEASTCGLQNGHIKSCGCIETHEDLSGRRFGKLIVVKLTDNRTSDRRMIWSCVCDCGRACEVRSKELTSGDTQSCGCKKLIDYDGHRFRSRWEIYWYMAAKARGLDVQYEPRSIPVTIDGKTRQYRPDFLLSDGCYVEVKGRQRQEGMSKLHRARMDGLNIQLVTRSELQQWCGLTIHQMNKAHSTSGMDAVKTIIEASIGGI